ncbi:hypothetical protein NFA_3620 [Nocardia farcinica IFM 10152]|uniref:DUF4244 domain-containing protein n=1 Tax=Nocardia farcinica (strain IFM 10152) TaxID=247156 RepID=Q5Z2Y7_NOCFA|nr:hypothetical protein NFA_3620 [Nocardia farcinica IFM 10152]
MTGGPSPATGCGGPSNVPARTNRRGEQKGMSVQITNPTGGVPRRLGSLLMVRRSHASPVPPTAADGEANPPAPTASAVCSPPAAAGVPSFASEESGSAESVGRSDVQAQPVVLGTSPASTDHGCGGEFSTTADLRRAVSSERVGVEGGCGVGRVRAEGGCADVLGEARPSAERHALLRPAPPAENRTGRSRSGRGIAVPRSVIRGGQAQVRSAVKGLVHWWGARAESSARVPAQLHAVPQISLPVPLRANHRFDSDAATVWALRRLRTAVPAPGATSRLPREARRMKSTWGFQRVRVRPSTPPPNPAAPGCQAPPSAPVPPARWAPQARPRGLRLAGLLRLLRARALSPSVTRSSTPGRLIRPPHRPVEVPAPVPEPTPASPTDSTAARLVPSPMPMPIPMPERNPETASDVPSVPPSAPSAVGEPSMSPHGTHPHSPCRAASTRPPETRAPLPPPPASSAGSSVPEAGTTPCRTALGPSFTQALHHAASAARRTRLAAPAPAVAPAAVGGGLPSVSALATTPEVAAPATTPGVSAPPTTPGVSAPATTPEVLAPATAPEVAAPATTPGVLAPATTPEVALDGVMTARPSIGVQTDPSLAAPDPVPLAMALDADCAEADTRTSLGYQPTTVAPPHSATTAAPAATTPAASAEAVARGPEPESDQGDEIASAVSRSSLRSVVDRTENGVWRLRTRLLHAAVADDGMSTAEYAIGTIAAAAFGAVLYGVVTGDSIVDALTKIIDKALNTSV